MIPLFHDFTGKRVVIFGGGSVAARKAALFASEAEVVVHSLTFEDRFTEIDCRCNRTAVDGELAATTAADAFLVIPATDDAVLNEEIADRAHAAGTLVNRVDEAGETVTPSVVSGEHVTVGISTGGRSPAVSKHLRQRIEPEIDAVDRMVDLQADLRQEADDLSEAARREFLWAVLEDERVRDALEAGNDERARELAMEHRP